MTIRPLAFAALGLLLGCGSEQTADDLSEEQVAEKLQAVRLEPGRWETSTEIVSATGPLPKAAIEGLLGRRTSASACITPEQAARPNATFMAAQQGADCAYHAFDVADGRLVASMTCSGGNLPARMRSEMSGRYSPDGYDLMLDMRTTGFSQSQTLEIRTRSVGRRTGDC